MTRREFWIFLALISLLTLATFASILWGEPTAKTIEAPSPEVWVGRITAIGSALVAIITAIGTTFFLWMKFKELSHHVNSKMDEFLRVVDAAAYARGQISGSIKPEVKLESGTGPVPEAPREISQKTIQAAKETVVAAAKTVVAAAERAAEDPKPEPPKP